MAALVWGAVDSFDIPLERIWDMFLMTLIVVVTLVLAAAAAAALWIGIRRLSARD
jgi:5-bromo-4-chloroindolyl phosphate hydrolysis protein